MPPASTILSQSFKLLFSVFFLGLFVWFVTRPEFRNSLSGLKMTGGVQGGVIFLLAASLALPNWWLEARRWRALCLPFESIGSTKALQAVLGGLAIGVFTPGRLGECVGRLWHVSKENRVAAGVAWAAGGCIQGAVTFMAGLAAAAFYLQRQGNPRFLASYSPETMRPAVYLIVGFLVLFSAALLAWPGLLVKLKKLIPAGYAEPLRAWWRQSRSMLGKILMLSLARYAVFVIQFGLLLRLTGLCLPAGFVLELVSLTFFLTIFLPLLPVVEPLARTSLALLLYPELSEHAVALTAVPAMLWLINVLLPAAAGWMWVIYPKKPAR